MEWLVDAAGGNAPHGTAGPGSGGRRSAPETGTADRHQSVTATPTCKRCPETDPARFSRKRDRRGRQTYQPYCKPCAVVVHREWRETQVGRAKMRAGVNASRKRYPDRARARNLLNAAVRRGDLERGPCYAEGPDCAGQIEGHHDDYSRPLTVVWCCRAHHRALDRARRGAA